MNEKKELIERLIRVYQGGCEGNVKEDAIDSLIEQIRSARW
jgi:hypothetical protein